MSGLLRDLINPAFWALVAYIGFFIAIGLVFHDTLMDADPNERGRHQADMSTTPETTPRISMSPSSRISGSMSGLAGWRRMRSFSA